MTSLSRRFCGAFLSTAIAASTALAQESDDLAKQLANPVANLVSVPFQSNYDFDVGEEEGFRYTLNVQPVLPWSSTTAGT